MTNEKRALAKPGEIETYPVLPLRDIVVFPHMIVPLFVGRDKSIRALEEVMKGDRYILLRRRTPFSPPARSPRCCNC
jgi:ATP-dependent Lon protease